MSAQSTFAEAFLTEAAQIVAKLDRASLEKAAKLISSPGAVVTASCVRKMP